MRHTSSAIQKFLAEQPKSGQTIANFCANHHLKAPTFYAWKRKYAQPQISDDKGFYKIIPRQELTERSLRLPSGLRLELIGLSITEIAELLLEIDRAHA